MAIANHIERVKEGIRRGAYTSEAAVSQGIILPILTELGWPVFDTNIVMPEFSVEGRRVDYALCHPESRPAVFIEVKKVGNTESADRQLFEYAFHVGVPMAILTDGQEWNFYLPGEQGGYDERRVYKIDLLERSTKEAEERLVKHIATIISKIVIYSRTNYFYIIRMIFTEEVIGYYKKGTRRYHTL